MYMKTIPGGIAGSEYILAKRRGREKINICMQRKEEKKKLFD